MFCLSCPWPGLGPAHYLATARTSNQKNIDEVFLVCLSLSALLARIGSKKGHGNDKQKLNMCTNLSESGAQQKTALFGPHLLFRSLHHSPTYPIWSHEIRRSGPPRNARRITALAGCCTRNTRQEGELYIVGPQHLVSRVCWIMRHTCMRKEVVFTGGAPRREWTFSAPHGLHENPGANGTRV